MAYQFSAKRYAQALFELGVEHNKLDEWLADLDAVTALSRDAEVLAYLTNPGIGLEAKSALLARNMPALARQVLNLVSLLIERGAAGHLAKVADEYRRMLDEKRGVARGQFAAAVALDEAEVQHLSRQVSGILNKKVALKGVVDEGLLGGVVVRVGDKLLDGSVRTAFATLKQRLS